MSADNSTGRSKDGYTNAAELEAARQLIERMPIEHLERILYWTLEMLKREVFIKLH